MLRSNRIAPFAAAVLLLALAGCDLTAKDLAEGVPPAVAALAVPPLGQELLRMRAADQADASIADSSPKF